MESTVHGVALVFEGGGMRNSYSAGALTVMLENGLYFDDVYGLSAGATNAIDYVSRDVRRAQSSFTATLDGLSFRGWVEPFVDADGFGDVYKRQVTNSLRARPSCVRLRSLRMRTSASPTVIAVPFVDGWFPPLNHVPAPAVKKQDVAWRRHAASVPRSRGPGGGDERGHADEQARAPESGARDGERCWKRGKVLGAKKRR